MKKIILSIVLAVCFLTVKADQRYDVVIYGGTSAGVVAAYQIKKLGKSVVIIAPDGHIGGLSSGGLGATDIGNKQAIGGISRDFYKKLGKVYGKEESWVFEPKEAMKIYQDMLTEMDIPVIYLKKIKNVSKKGAIITAITFVNTFGKEDKATVETINAKIFLDCTYEGDLFAKAKVSFAIGRENNADYKETYNGFYLAEYRKKSGGHQFPDNVSPYKVPGDPKSGLVYGISKGKSTEPGKGDRKLQAYNFRICLTDSVENQIPITKPDDYQPARYELLARLFAAQPKLTKVNNYFIWSKMPNRKTDVNNRGGFSTDMIGANYNWPEADFDERMKIYNEHLSYTKGLLYFITTDTRVADHVRNYVKGWGYPKDEYLANNHFTPQLYIREGRRLIGEYVMTEHNCTGKEVVPDPIGMAAYTMDSHNIQRIVVNGMVKNEGNVEVGGFKPYPISYRSIVPKKKECTNLLVPVSLSSTHIAFGSIRMEPVFMILGQSAAFAAVQAIDENKGVQDIDYEKLKVQLLQHNQVLN
jgi:hypothetical protein